MVKCMFKGIIKYVNLKMLLCVIKNVAKFILKAMYVFKIKNIKKITKMFNNNNKNKKLNNKIKSPI